MITIDDRIGSRELEKLFKPYSVKVQVKRLPFGDFEWWGRGPRNKRVLVGLERKRIDDFLQSMTGGRLSGHQLPGMADRFDYAYLVVEGFYRVGREGEIQVMQGRDWVTRGVHSRAVNNYLMGLNFRAGLTPWRTTTKEETVAFIVDQYRMWTEKAWDEHTAHEHFYAPALVNAKNNGRGMFLRVVKPKPVEQLAYLLPGIDDRAKVIARRFPTIGALLRASESEIAEVTTRDKNGNYRRLGDKVAQKIHAFLHD